MRNLPRPSARAIVLAAIALAIAAGATLTSRGSQPTTANPIYGSVKLNPTSQFVIEGYRINVATWMTTCAYNTPGVPNNFYCQLGAYGVNINYDPAMFELSTSTGTSTGGNATNTLKDTTRTNPPAPAPPNPLRWRANAWAGSSVTLTGGLSAGQTRVITSNTADTLVLAKEWDPFPAELPDGTTTYLIGGMTNGDFLGSNNGIIPIIPNSGRAVSCPVGPAYGVGWAELHCVTLGDPATKGAYGNGRLTNLSLLATGRGLASFTFTLPPAVSGTRVMKVDSLDIPVDIFQTGSRRVMLCPDSAGGPLIGGQPSPDGRVNSTDQLAMALAWEKKGPLWVVPGGHTPYPEYPAPQLGYTVTKDPDESGRINSTDMLMAAGVFNLKCIQP